MNEYISREAVVRYLKGFSEKELNSSGSYGMITSSVLNKAERAISEMPAADVQSVNGWIAVKDRLPKNKMDNVLFTLYTPAWHDLTDDFPEDERDFPEQYVTVCGSFDVFANGERFWSWVSSDGYEGVIRNEYEKNYTGEITYITHWMPLPEPPKEKNNE